MAVPDRLVSTSPHCVQNLQLDQTCSVPSGPSHTNLRCAPHKKNSQHKPLTPWRSRPAGSARASCAAQNSKVYWSLRRRFQVMWSKSRVTSLQWTSCTSRDSAQLGGGEERRGLEHLLQLCLLGLVPLRTRLSGMVSDIVAWHRSCLKKKSSIYA